VAGASSADNCCRRWPHLRALARQSTATITVESADVAPSLPLATGLSLGGSYRPNESGSHHRRARPPRLPPHRCRQAKKMTAKDKQQEFIKAYLKPKLKEWGYQTSGQTWWKDKGDFFNVISLQNYSWNSKDSVDFRFNIGIALKATLKDERKKKATYSDLTVHLDEGTFLPDRINRKFGDNQGYSITDKTDLKEFLDALKADFETYILPGLEKPKSLEDCISYYGQFSFWGENLRRVIKEYNLVELS